MFVADSLKKSKQRFGEFKYFEGFDVANKLENNPGTKLIVCVLILIFVLVSASGIADNTAYIASNAAAILDIGM